MAEWASRSSTSSGSTPHHRRSPVEREDQAAPTPWINPRDAPASRQRSGLAPRAGAPSNHRWRRTAQRSPRLPAAWTTNVPSADGIGSGIASSRELKTSRSKRVCRFPSLDVTRRVVGKLLQHEAVAARGQLPQPLRASGHRIASKIGAVVPEIEDVEDGLHELLHGDSLAARTQAVTAYRPKRTASAQIAVRLPALWDACPARLTRSLRTAESHSVGPRESRSDRIPGWYGGDRSQVCG